MLCDLLEHEDRMANQLHKAKAAQNDEFFTQYADIEREVNAYYEYNKDVFRDKTILLPCDDPEWSNFTKYFVANFDRFGLKKLISTSYAKSYSNKIITDFEKSASHFDEEKHKTNGRIFTVSRKDIGKVDFDDIRFNYLDGDGDFQSEEVCKLRDESDFVVTNPPFSLFKTFLPWIGEDRKFLIIGSLNAVKYKEVFPLFMQDKVWFGSSYFNGGAAFFIAPKELYDPSKMSNAKNAFIQDGKFMWRVNGVRWFTNIEHGHRHEKLGLMTAEQNKRFNQKLMNFCKSKNESPYCKYDNYDAIDVPYCSGIPSDYDGVMGVPFSFFDKYCPEQFEIIGEMNHGSDNIFDLAKPTVGGKERFPRVLIRFRK